jgi:hypothetical protein
MDFKEIKCEVKDSIHYPYCRVQRQAVLNTVMNLGLQNCCEFLDHLSNCQLLKKNSPSWN